MSETRHYDAGSDEGGENWACMASLIETCKLHEVNPLTYMTELLTRLVNGWPHRGTHAMVLEASERDRVLTHRLLLINATDASSSLLDLG
jgi:IS66 C-terminal element